MESSPAVANGVVYVGSLNQNVYALNAKTGAKLWSYKTGGQVSFSPPAVVEWGGLCSALEDGNVYALKASTGALLVELRHRQPRRVFLGRSWRMGYSIRAFTLCSRTCSR